MKPRSVFSRVPRTTTATRTWLKTCVVRVTTGRVGSMKQGFMYEWHKNGTKWQSLAVFWAVFCAISSAWRRSGTGLFGTGRAEGAERKPRTCQALCQRIARDSGQLPADESSMSHCRFDRGTTGRMCHARRLGKVVRTPAHLSLSSSILQFSGKSKCRRRNSAGKSI